MCRLVSSSARATSVAVMWAHALRAAAGGIFLLSTTANLCVVGPGCGSVKALPSDEPYAAKGTVPAASLRILRIWVYQVAHRTAGFAGLRDLARRPARCLSVGWRVLLELLFPELVPRAGAA
jgi:hypothetical protein